MSRVPGTYKNAPPELRRDLSPEGAAAEQMILRIGALAAARYTLGSCTIMVAREPLGGNDWRWHLSIAHPSRYPTWDEMKAAIFGIAEVQGVMLAQVLTPGDDSAWVNIHENTFHWYEIHDEVMSRM